jgi:chorismate-pyruvate lyase
MQVLGVLFGLSVLLGASVLLVRDAPVARADAGSGSGSGSSAPARPLSPAWSNDFLARVEALAVLQTLNAELLSHDSATLTLDRWCDAHHLASPAKVIALRDRGVTKDATADQRKLLGVSATEPIRYRRVKLACGAHVLTEADNWYVPSRLTAEMTRQLDTTDIAFGRAVLALHFQRKTLSARLLWSPLPEGWEFAGGALSDPGARTLQVPHAVLEHQVVLVLPDGTAISLVIETYTEQVLAFPQPRSMK